MLTIGLAACGGTPPGTGGSTAAPASPAPPPSTGPTSTAAAGTPGWTMPDMVGSNLQDAQDAIQRLTDYGIAVTYSHDETGAGRQQVVDRNWTVCSQNVPPGASITPSTRIDFGAAKTGERC